MGGDDSDEGMDADVLEASRGPLVEQSTNLTARNSGPARKSECATNSGPARKSECATNSGPARKSECATNSGPATKSGRVPTSPPAAQVVGSLRAKMRQRAGHPSLPVCGRFSV
eukprot:scaffold4417_cov51-Isochrysis_galbana.AAC.1